MSRHSRRRAGHNARLGHDRNAPIEALEPRLVLTILLVTSLADGPVNLNDTAVTLRDAIEAAKVDVAPARARSRAAARTKSGSTSASRSRARSSSRANWESGAT